MCSFGEGVSMTPLQLGALVSAIANGGTLYYLQHPHIAEEVLMFQPQVKRTLDIATIVPEIQDGMHAAVQYGTARSLRANFNRNSPVLAKDRHLLRIAEPASDGLPPTLIRRRAYRYRVLPSKAAGRHSDREPRS